jgi:hypothetical protein
MSRLAEATDILKKIKPKNRLEEAEALLSEINQPLGFQTQQMEPIVESDPDYQMSLKEAMSKKPVFDKPTIATQIDGMPQNKPVQPDFESVIRPEEKPSWGDTLYQSLFSGMLESGKQLAGIGKLPTQLINAGREIGQKYAQRMATRWDPAKSIGQIVAKKPEIEPIETEQTRNINQTLEGAEQIQGLINEKLEKGTPAQKYLGKIIQSLPPVVSARLLGSGYGNGLSAFMTLAGSSYAREAELEGATPAQQLVYGGIMGLIEGGTEYLTLGKTIDTIFQQGGKPALMAWLKSIPENALQEVAADVASALTKWATYQPNAELPTVKQLGESAALGAGTAGLLGAGAMIPNISQREVVPEVQSQVQPVQEQIQTPEYAGSDHRVDLEVGQQEGVSEHVPNIEGMEKRDIKKSLIDAINQAKEDGLSVGLRVPTKLSSMYSKEYALKNNLPYDEGNDYNIGDILGPSYVWDDGEPTQDQLEGTSVIEVNEKNIEKALELIGQYPNAEDLLIVSGEKHSAGDDIGEALFRKAKVIDKFKFAELEKYKPKREISFREFVESKGKSFDEYDYSKVDTPEWKSIVDEWDSLSKTDRIKLAEKIDSESSGSKKKSGQIEPPKEAVSSSEKALVKSGESDIISSNEKPSPIPGRDRSGTSSQSSISKLDETIKQTEIEAAAVTERNLKDVGPKLGLVNNPLPGLPKAKRLDSGYSFSDAEMEREWRKSHGITKPSVIERVKDFMTDLKHKATREYVHLPRTAEFAQLRNDLLKLAKQKNVSGDRAVRFLQAELVRLDPKSMGLFERSVLINDLAAEAKKDNPSLPPGFTPDKVFAEKRLKDQQVEDNLRVKEALKLRKKINDSIIADYIQVMDAVGFDVKDKFKNEDYFRHQVLEYANVKGLVGAGKKLKTPTNRGTLKHRSGYGGSINTNYLEAEYEVLAQMLEDIEIAKTIKSVQENYDISDKVKAEAKKQDLDDWHDAIPEGYVSWQPRQGNAFFMVDSIPAKLASQLNEGLLEEIGVTQNDLRRALAVGGLRKEFVVKEEVANTLDELVTPKADGLLKQFRKSITAAWKVNALFNPRRLIKYNLRNISSDAEWTAIGNPRAFSKTPQATKDLFEVIFLNKPMAPEFREWFQRGGMESTLYVQELGDLNKLKVFEHLFKKYPDITKVPKNVWERYWKTAGTLTQFREAILRYSNYLEYLDQMQGNKEGKPKNFGASIPEEVMAIKDIRDRAFWMSNDLSGAYDRVSALGQEIRSQVYPFWSFVEINFKRYIQFAKNQARDGNLAGAVGKHFIRTAPRVAYGIGKFTIKATAFWSMLQAYNYLLFRDEEEELPPDVQSRPHIIFGRDKDGKIKYFDRLGSLGDFLEWFGLDEAPGLVKDFLNGRRTIREIAVEMAKSPVNKIVGGMSPFYKLLPEVLMKKQLYPDAFKPSRIRDIGVYLAKQIGIENEYKEVMGLPTRGYGKTAEGAVWYSIEPKESAYYAILDEKQRFQKKVGKYQEGYSESARSNALYNLKLAMRYGDKKATDKYLQKYVELGGNAKGFDRSMKSLDPLYGLGKNEKAFVESLNPEQKKQLKMAQEFYEEIVAGKKELKNEIIKQKKAAN